LSFDVGRSHMAAGVMLRGDVVAKRFLIIT